MQPITKLIFTGVDGSKYKFDVYPRDIRVKEALQNPCSQVELNKIVPFGFSLQRQKNGVFFAIKIV